jgi:hypothetical protein
MEKIKNGYKNEVQHTVRRAALMGFSRVEFRLTNCYVLRLGAFFALLYRKFYFLAFF